MKSHAKIMNRTPLMNRREFLAASLTGLALGVDMIQAQESHASGIPRRALGKTGQKVSIIGVGGWDIGNVKDPNEAVAIMHEAIDQGVNFFDNCWDYHDGGSEEVMGKALASDGRRDKVILMTKVCARSYQGAMKHLEDSLRRLKTDHLDLWQFHGIQWDDDPDLIFDEQQGAVRAALEARKAGKVRFIGFTGHKDPKFHLAMLAKSFAWDAVQMPLNVLDAHYRSFQHLVLTECVKRGLGVIGMKALGAQNGIIVRRLGVRAELARRYVLSLPISSLICGMQSRENLRQDLALARDFKPLTPAEMTELANQVQDAARDGKIEAYKVGNYGCDWHHKQPK
jgi:aryl-alcohol dehydrogenase-like predicted oxidoreductase